MREFHLPVWLGAAPVSHAMVFALLFFIESIARTILRVLGVWTKAAR